MLPAVPVPPPSPPAPIAGDPALPRLAIPALPPVSVGPGSSEVPGAPSCDEEHATRTDTTADTPKAAANCELHDPRLSRAGDEFVCLKWLLLVSIYAVGFASFDRKISCVPPLGTRSALPRSIA